MREHDDRAFEHDEAWKVTGGCGFLVETRDTASAGALLHESALQERHAAIYKVLRSKHKARGCAARVLHSLQYRFHRESEARRSAM